ncbi:MAG: YoaK family protein [Reyranella sp.]|uniref:YoaK family protein n=2 Tax=Reyranella sp. TaxID=1929291 RepID=UPI003D148463
MTKDTSFGPVPTMSLLAFTSGFVDTLSFIALFGLFAAHVTGNFVLIATSLAEFRHGLWIKLLAIPIFVLATVLTRLYIIRRERHERDAAAHVMLGQVVLLAAFMVVAVWHSPFQHHEDSGAFFTALLAASAMAVQNTAARTFLSGLPPTTVMTGNLIQVIVDMVDIAHGHGNLEVKRLRLARLGPMLLSFIAGTMLGAVGYVTVGFYSLIVPIVTVAALALRIRPHTVPA